MKNLPTVKTFSAVLFSFDASNLSIVCEKLKNALTNDGNANT